MANDFYIQCICNENAYHIYFLASYIRPSVCLSVCHNPAYSIFLEVIDGAAHGTVDFLHYLTMMQVLIKFLYLCLRCGQKGLIDVKSHCIGLIIVPF